MAAWEIDIELRVRKTLIFSGPLTEAAAREITTAMVTGGMLATIQKYTYERGKPEPVETITDNDPQIVAVREVDEL